MSEDKPMPSREAVEALKAAYLRRDTFECALMDAYAIDFAALRAENETWKRDYDLLAERTNQLETLVGNIAMLLRKEMEE